LDPHYFRSPSLGKIWNFFEGPGFKPSYCPVLCSDGHLSTTIGRMWYWSALGSLCWSVRPSHTSRY
jgi:hypothetical protein